jgi:putative redox protein
VPTAIARRREGYTHDVEIDGHTVVVDEPEADGGTNLGPSPSRLLACALASCTAITIEMYANRKGWDLGPVEVAAELEYGEASLPKRFEVTIRVAKDLSEEQLERLRVIAGKCPVHRALSNEVEVEIRDRIEQV